MVPAAAFAEAGDGASEDASLTLLAETQSQAIQKGDIVTFKDGLTSGVSSTAGDDAKVLVADKIQPDNTTGEDNQVTAVDTVYYKVSSTGAKLTTKNATTGYQYGDSADILVNGKTVKVDISSKETGKTIADVKKTPGTWVAVALVNNGNDKITVANAATFTINAISLEDAQLFEVASDTTDVSDKTFEFNAAGTAYEFGSTQGNIGLELNGEVLTYNTDYTVKIFNEKYTAVETPTFAGNYIVEITGVAGSKYESSTAIKKTLTISAIDISKASIELDNLYVGETYPASSSTTVEIANGTQATGISTYNGTAYVAKSGLLEIQKYNKARTAVGSYTATVGLKPIVVDSTAEIKSPAQFSVDETAITVKDEATKTKLQNSISGTQDVNFYITNATATNLTATYDGKTWGSSCDFTVDYSSSNVKEFDTSKVVVTVQDPSDSSKTKTLTASEYDLVVTKQVTGTSNYEAASISDLKNPGVYKIQVVLNAAALDYAISGQTPDKITVTVKNGDVQSSTIAFTYNGAIVTSLNKEYTGDNFLDSIVTTVKTTKGTTVLASDYTVAVTKTVDGKDVAVDKIVDAGSYKLTVKSDKYDIPNSGNTLSVTISKKTIDNASVDPDYTTYTYDNVSNNVTTTKLYFYTGSEITPVYQYNTAASGNAVYKDLPEGSYKATITSFTGSDGVEVTSGSKLPTVVKEPGVYKVKIETAKDEQNYTYNVTDEVIFTVSDTKVFIDVPSSAWYAKSVYQAANAGYVRGYNDSNVFGPNDNIKRQDVVVILARMAGVESDDEDHSSSDGSYTTTFTDVDSSAYYAKAVAWAQKAGIVTGTSATTFEPGRDVTRQEFATMLARYAALRDGSANGAATSLAKYADGTAVANWAQTNVAWAVENGIMGVNTTVLNPTSSISRAEVTAMVVRYQPERDQTLA
jgi:hypothetical protein